MYAASPNHGTLQATAETHRYHGHDGPEGWTYAKYCSGQQQTGSYEAVRVEEVQQILRREDHKLLINVLVPGMECKIGNKRMYEIYDVLSNYWERIIDVGTEFTRILRKLVITM